MRLRDCVRLLVVGVCTGLLPACLGGGHPVMKPDFAQVDRAAPSAPTVQANRPNWSPYGAVAMPAGGVVTAGTTPPLDKTPLPTRPALLGKDGVPDAQPPSMPAADADAGPTGVTTAGHSGDGPPAPSGPPTRVEDVFRPRSLPGALSAESPLVDALRTFQDKRPEVALEYLKRFDPENQDILLHLLPLTVRMAEGPLSQADPQEIAALLDQLQGLMLALRPRAALVMDKMCFCRQVRKFGVYEALGERPAFRRGEMVEVYCELRNVACERYQSPKGEYRTHLQSSCEVRNGVGFVLRSKTDKADVSHTPQQDYFLRYSFEVKNDMRPGPHVVTVEVVDVPTGRKVSRKLEFVVRAE